MTLLRSVVRYLMLAWGIVVVLPKDSLAGNITQLRSFTAGRTKSTWALADQACQAEFGTRLATITSAEDNARAAEACRTATGGAMSSDCWIGLNDIDVEGAFVWTSGATLVSTFWNSGEPNNDGAGEDCTSMLWANGKWIDRNCGSVLSYICDAPITRTPTSVSPTIATKSPSRVPTRSPSFAPSVAPTRQMTPSISAILSPTSTPSRNRTAVPSSGGSTSPAASGYYQVGDRVTIPVFDERSSTAFFGYAVAMSADARVALVGSPTENGQGAARVYTYGVSGWVSRVRLREDGTLNGHFGGSVAISGNGSMVVVGAWNYGPNGEGMIFVYHWDGSVAVRRQAIENPVPVSQSFFGQVVTISGDGRAICAGQYRAPGAVYCFRASYSRYDPIAATVLPPDLEAFTLVHRTLDISDDASTLVVGQCTDRAYKGAFRVYEYHEGTHAYLQIGDQITEPDSNRLGCSLKMSGDGKTIIAGSLGILQVYQRTHDALVFTRFQTIRSGSVGATIDFSFDGLGLSDNGAVLMVGDIYSSNGGRVHVFTRDNATVTFSLPGTTLAGTFFDSNQYQGASLDVSGDGASLIVGGPYGVPPGQVWYFARGSISSAIP